MAQTAAIDKISAHPENKKNCVCSNVTAQSLYKNIR